MAMNKDSFKESITAALLQVSSENAVDGVSMESAISKLAGAIADQVDAYIRTATIIIPPGKIEVQQITSSPSPQLNPNTIAIDNALT